jgi:hypothetical protein
MKSSLVGGKSGAGREDGFWSARRLSSGLRDAAVSALTSTKRL